MFFNIIVEEEESIYATSSESWQYVLEQEMHYFLLDIIKLRKGHKSKILNAQLNHFYSQGRWRYCVSSAEATRAGNVRSEISSEMGCLESLSLSTVHLKVQKSMCVMALGQRGLEEAASGEVEVVLLAPSLG